MLRPIAVLWLAAPALQPHHRADVDHWARSHGLEPRERVVATVAQRHDPGVVARIEALLAEARQAGSAIGTGSEVFRLIDRMLTAHPELPQAPWLLGERLALEARFQRRGGDVEGGADPAAAPRAASDVVGPRAPVLGETTAPRAMAAASTLSLRVSLRPGDRVLVDAQPHAPGRTYSAGRHHLQLLRGGHRLEARWLELGTGQETAITYATEPCSAEDFLGAEDSATRPRVPAGVSCPEWLAASRTTDGRTRLSLCHGSDCEPWQSSAPEVASSADPALVRDELRGASLPSWLTWTLVGAGAAVTTGLVLWQVGAFEGSEAGTEFVFTGPTAASLRF